MKKLSSPAKRLLYSIIFLFVLLLFCLIASVLNWSFLITAVGFFIGIAGLVTQAGPPIIERQDFGKACAELLEFSRSIPLEIARRAKEGWQNQKRPLSRRAGVLLALALVAVSAVSAIVYNVSAARQLSATKPGISPTPITKTTDIQYLSDRQPVGLSDGSNVFDLERRGGSDDQQQYYWKLKRDGADAFKKGNQQLARQDWNAAIRLQPYSNDAETLIYLEDLNVSSYPTITFVLVTQLTGNQSAVNRGRDDLQGAYVALSEFNNRKDAHVLARLVIANIGDQSAGADYVKNKIIQLSSTDKTFAGVLGWPERTGAVDQALSDLCTSNIPIVTISSATDPSAKSSCDFSVAPSSDAQAAAAADFAATRLHATRVAIIYDSANAYSKNMEELFGLHFRAANRIIIDKENYTLGYGEALGGLVQAALRGEPDMIYFVGDPDDVGAVFQELQKERVMINVLSTDALYRASYYAATIDGVTNYLYFTASAYPDEWNIFHLSQPAFINDYIQDFDPQHSHGAGIYGFERADNDALIAYDAMSTTLAASQRVLGTDKTSVLPSSLLQALPTVKLQGISGPIQFDARGNAIDKPVIVVSVNAADQRVYASYIKGSYLCSTCAQFLQDVGG